MTQREVSESLGRSHSYLSKCETGERSVDVIDLLQLAKLYGEIHSILLSGAELSLKPAVRLRCTAPDRRSLVGRGIKSLRRRFREGRIGRVRNRLLLQPT
jgi:transcriptional regulator with XRE-family HTH domain